MSDPHPPNSVEEPRPRNFAPVYQLLLGLFLFACAMQAIWQFLTRGVEDFVCFYVPALAMRHGEDIYTAAHGEYIYPPLFAFLLQPLTFFSQSVAASLWSVITVFLMFAAFALTGKAVARRWHFNAEPIDPALPWKIAA
ncbi:MAG: DUF2029 domain-containing protein, partial [Verrucomicrobiota bacterium]|nr:DUF2029 domain-containing protein [Verrucomicrobiota bacterium]